MISQIKEDYFIGAYKVLECLQYNKSIFLVCPLSNIKKLNPFFLYYFMTQIKAESKYYAFYFENIPDKYLNYFKKYNVPFISKKESFLPKKSGYHTPCKENNFNKNLIKILKEGLKSNLIDDIYLNAKDLPLALKEFCYFKLLNIDGKDYFFVEYKNISMVTLDQLLGQLKQVEGLVYLEVVLFLNEITKIQYDFLKENNISFIVGDGMIHLKDFSNLDNIKISFTNEKAVLNPNNPMILSSIEQLILLEVIYENCKGIEITHLLSKLGVSKNSGLKALNNLKNLGLFDLKEKNLIICKYIGVDLFLKALKFLSNPVKYSYILSNKFLKGTELKSGISALEGYSDLCSSNEVYLVKEDKSLEENRVSYLYSFKDYSIVQSWWYNPRVLSKNGVVDPISLFLTLKDSKDERVRIALSQMLDNLFNLEGNEYVWSRYF